MTKPTYEVVPQRSDGRCFVPCEIHKATSFAVIETIKWTRQRKRYTSSRVIKRFSTKNAAHLEAAAMARRSESPTLYKLGRRIIKEAGQ